MHPTEAQTVAAGHNVDGAPARWQAGLEALRGRVAAWSAPVQPHRPGPALVLGLLAELPRKHVWTIAEHAGAATPDGTAAPAGPGGVEQSWRAR